MASTSTLPIPKRKKQVYGKLVNRSKWNVDSFFDDDERPSSDALPTTRQRPASESNGKAEGKSESNTTIAKSNRPRPKRHDTFDIPSSDQDEVTSPAKPAPPPKFHRKVALYDDTDSSAAQLAPWERKKLQEKTPKKARSTSSPASPEAQLRQDLMRALSSPEALKSNTPSPKDKSVKIVGSKDQHTEPQQSSAMARLAARKQDSAIPSSKRLALAADSPENTPRKRARTSSVPRESTCDSPLRNSADELEHRKSPIALGKETDGAMDVYEFPGSSEDERPHRRSKQPSPKPAPNRVRKGGKLTTYASRTTMQKGLSAPSRLTEMLNDTDSTEAPTRSPSAPSRLSSPQQLPSTPPHGANESPDTVAKAPGTTTPKQAQLWYELLPGDKAASSPSALRLKDLTISKKRRSGGEPSDRKLSKSTTHVPRRQTRLVDRLKASAPSSDDVSVADEEDEEEADDKEMEGGVPATLEPPPLPARPTLAQRMSSQTAQSQRQLAAIAQSGPKITYAQSRSYLQEESLEHDFMASLAADTSQDASQTRGNGLASQKSAFDLDSEDESAAGGKIRTIHELRAAGRNVSGMYDIEELLSEIQNHNPSHRGRRRSALLELSTKLMDKTFAVRFTEQSLEIELAAECGPDSDHVADFVLATAIELILISEPPQHTIRSFRDQGVVSWLARLLDRNVEVRELAKSRHNNMSKAAQASLIQFSEMLAKQTPLWLNGPPNAMTTRLIAQKALDQLISKLRRLGDRSELLGENQISNILPNAIEVFNPGKQIDLELAISILESLSTSTSSLSWPAGTLHSISEILPRLDPSSSTQQHTVFLMLRLCLNLSNDNVSNCQLLSASPAVVHYLLHSVTQAFSRLDTTEIADEQARALALDLLVLAMGILINLAEHCDAARQHALRDHETLSSLIAIFQHGQKHMLEAESVEESVTNVAFGYLAVVLANLCRNPEAGRFVAERLPGKNLGMLVEAVEEFVAHHSKVDMMNFEGEEGAEVWSAFTEKLRVVLEKLKGAEV